MAVALYARVSTTRQAENDLSIPDQLKQMREWCDANDYSVAIEYIELGASAKDDKRPVFQDMITDATMTPSPYEAIIIHSLSRFFRDFVERRNSSGSRARFKILSSSSSAGPEASLAITKSERSFSQKSGRLPSPS